MAVLKVFCSYWVRRAGLRESPFWRVKLSYGRVEQLPRSLTRSEMRKLLACARRNYSPSERAESREGRTPEGAARVLTRAYRALRDLALVDLLFATGMRVGEASALDVRDFAAKEKVFRVQGKGAGIGWRSSCMKRRFGSNVSTLKPLSGLHLTNRPCVLPRRSGV